MVTRNPNWSIEILWYGTGYVKGKILHPLNVLPEADCIADFYLKLLNIYCLCSDGLLMIFLTLAPVNIQLRILPTLRW